MEAGAYHRVPVEPELSEPEVPAYWSKVFDAPIRMLPDLHGNDADMQDRPERWLPAPVFQWYDVQQGRWRDRAADEADRQRQEGRLAVAVDLLRRSLPGDAEAAVRAQVEEHWRIAGTPEDVVDRLLAVQQTPGGWRSLLGIPSDDGIPD